MTDDSRSDNNPQHHSSETDDEPNDKRPIKLGDDLIAVIRELVQLTLLTGTNVVDHLRALTCEVDKATNKLVPTEDYTEAYNQMIEQLVKQAEEAGKELEGVDLIGNPDSEPN